MSAPLISRKWKIAIGLAVLALLYVVTVQIIKWHRGANWFKEWSQHIEDDNKAHGMVKVGSNTWVYPTTNLTSQVVTNTAASPASRQMANVSNVVE